MKVAFEMIQGDSKFITVECYNSDGTPIDLSTASDIDFAVVSLGKYNGTPLISKSLGSGIVIQNTNEAVVSLEESDTISLRGKYEFTFKIRDFSSKNYSIKEIFIINGSAL